MRRRRFLRTLALTPLVAVGSLGGGLVGGCSAKGNWPEGMVEIKWDRDTCARCNMVISDRRFAAQIRGGPEQRAFKFDDIGCAMVWISEKAATYPWMNDVVTRIWVADMSSRGDQQAWLDARSARYVPGKISPMGYNQSAVGMADLAPTLDFTTMRAAVLAKGK